MFLEVFHTILLFCPLVCLCQQWTVTLIIAAGANRTGCSKKTDPLICFCNNFGKCTPILILLSLLQQENYCAQNLSYFSHLTFLMLPLYLAKQTLMLYQCHYYVILVFVHNLLHFNAFNHLHRPIWAE